MSLLQPGSRMMEMLSRPMCVISITNRCQQHCGFCVEGRVRGSPPACHDLSLTEVDRLLHRARRLGAGVIFMGAESTLHPDFVSIVGRAARLGLKPGVSTNLLRFSDAGFLDRCVEAGLQMIEFSFHYPDAKVFSQVTGTPAGNFDRLLAAMENLDRLCRKPGSSFFGAAVNIILLRQNIRHLEKILAHLRRHLGSAFRLLLWKRLMLITHGPAPQPIDPLLAPKPEELRAALTRVLGRWPLPRVCTILRDFPLCVAPGYAHLNADLIYHCRRTLFLKISSVPTSCLRPTASIRCG
jgi:MoaA/NifB/PqqE/SkfB family radical SAM enzyme